MHTAVFCTPVATQNVLTKVIALVQSSESEIVVTFSDADSSSVKPNEKYFAALSEKIKQGVQVKRFIFGEKVPPRRDALGVRQVLVGPPESYQRAVISDNRRAMFKLGEHFFYTEYEPMVKVLRKYVIGSKHHQQITSVSK
jgi:hypothetical protein